MTFYCQFDCYRGYLNAVGHTRVLQYAVTSTILLHVILCYTLTQYYKLGVMGVSFSTMVTLGFSLLFVMIHSWKVSEFKISPIPRNIGMLMGRSDTLTYMSISGPTIVMIMAEWIGVEILIVIATFISTEASGAMSVSYNFHNCIYMIPYGFQLAMTAVIGNYVGA